MPDLNLDLHYFEHPKTRRLVSLLGRDADVLPLRLWAYVGRVHTETGILPGYTAQEIESLIGWRGDAGIAVDAMVKVGFLHLIGSDYHVHEWDEHEGHLIRFKRRGKQAAISRWKKGDYATSMQQACLKHATSNAPTTPTEPTKPTEPPEASPSADDDESFALSWLPMHYPDPTRLCFSSLRGIPRRFINTCKRFGRERTCAAVLEASVKPDVGEPVSYAEQVLIQQQNRAAITAESAKPRIFQEDY